jgi:hypothetical protein
MHDVSDTKNITLYGLEICATGSVRGFSAKVAVFWDVAP